MVFDYFVNECFCYCPTIRFIKFNSTGFVDVLNSTKSFLRAIGREHIFQRLLLYFAN